MNASWNGRHSGFRCAAGSPVAPALRRLSPENVQGEYYLTDAIEVLRRAGHYVHAMEADPIFSTEGDLDAARELVEKTDHAELFLYPGDQHLFADDSLPSYDEAAATLLLERTLAFLSR